MTSSGWTWRQNAVFWTVVLLAVLLPRWMLWQAVPVYLFSDDSHSYLRPAFEWVAGGDWETSARRGAVYSLLIGGALRFFGNLNALVPVQQLLGALAVLLAAAWLRLITPARLWWVATVCAAAYGLAGYVVYYGHLVRSEVVLMLFSTGALAAWGCYLQKKHAVWLLTAGGCFGLATLVKSLLLPLPVAVLVVLLVEKTRPLRLRLLAVAVFLTGAILPFAGQRALDHFTDSRRLPAPQSGILLYGRVAQWTVLDSGPHQEIKQRIRADIESYRTLPKLNNNIILKRTAVPKIYAWMQENRATEADVNRICRDLALEAIRSHPGPWLRQVWGDLVRLHLTMSFPLHSPEADDLQDAAVSTSKMKHQHPMLRQEEAMRVLGDPATAQGLGTYRGIVSGAWLFAWHPVLWTTLLLPLLAWRDRARRVFWLTLGAVWGFNVVIICTVGRPIPRYLMACMPVIFWTLAGAVLAMAAAVDERLGAGRVTVPPGAVRGDGSPD